MTGYDRMWQDMTGCERMWQEDANTHLVGVFSLLMVFQASQSGLLQNDLSSKNPTWKYTKRSMD